MEGGKCTKKGEDDGVEGEGLEFTKQLISSKNESKSSSPRFKTAILAAANVLSVLCFTSDTLP